MLENYVCKIFVKAITSNHDLLWLITWSISWVGWQIHSLSIHGWIHKINVILVHIWKVFFTLYVTVCTRVMVCKWVLDSETYSAIVCYQSTWYLYLIEKVLDVLDAIQVLWVLVFVLELANFKSTCTWLKYFRKYLTPTLKFSKCNSVLVIMYDTKWISITLMIGCQRQISMKTE